MKIFNIESFQIKVEDSIYDILEQEVDNIITIAKLLDYHIEYKIVQYDEKILFICIDITKSNNWVELNFFITQDGQLTKLQSDSKFKVERCKTFSDHTELQEVFNNVKCNL